MAPLAITSPAYEGPKALGYSKYASPAQSTVQLAAASAVPILTPSAAKSTNATKQQIAVAVVAPDMTPSAAELAVEQGAALKKEVERHTAKFAATVSNTVLNTRELLCLLRESTPGSEVVDSLWQELEQLFEALNGAKDALPHFMEKQRDNMSLYHSSMLNETIRETQAELDLQHKKVNTQHNLIFEQQEAFQNHRMRQTASSLKELEGLQERISRLTLEKGNFRTEVDRYKNLLEQETARKSEDLKTADLLQKEVETLISSEKKLQAENESLRTATSNTLKQLGSAEQRVTDRFAKDLAAKSEELQKEVDKTVSLNALVSTMRNSESAIKKDLDKTRTENRLLSVKYANQAAEHAAAFTKVKEQAKKIETLTADVDRFQNENVDLKRKMEEATEMTNRMASLTSLLKDAKDDATAAQDEVQILKAKLAMVAAPVASNDEAIVKKIKELEDERDTLQGALKDWIELAKRSYKEYKDMLPLYKEAETHRNDAADKTVQIAELKRQLATIKPALSNGAGAAAGADTAYWKNKYETLLSSL